MRSFFRNQRSQFSVKQLNYIEFVYITPFTLGILGYSLKTTRAKILKMRIFTIITKFLNFLNGTYTRTLLWKCNRPE